MQIGYRFRCYPKSAQKQKLSEWMGCQRKIFNSKVEQYEYDKYFAYRTMNHIGEHPPLDCTMSQFKDKELTPYLYDVPAVVLRNGAYIWRQTMQGFLKGLNRPAKRQRGHGEVGVWITSELFRFEPVANQETGEILSYRLFIGDKKKNVIGYIEFVAHVQFDIPNSIHIKRNGNQWYLSFNADNKEIEWTKEENIARVSQFTDDELSKATIGVDRGVAIPFATSKLGNFDYSDAQKKSLSKHDKYIRKYSRIAARRTKGGRNQKKAYARVAKYHAQIKDIRSDFSHKTSHAIATNPAIHLIGLEKLNNVGMVKRPKAKKDENGKWLRNNSSAKAGLNRAILGSVWGQFSTRVQYKAHRAGKVVLFVNPKNSSQECSNCCHTHAQNRKTQSDFACLSCGFECNADLNASLTIEKRTIAILREGVTVKKSKSRSIRRKKQVVEIGVDTSKSSVAKPRTLTETMLDDTIANAVVAQKSLKWETATRRSSNRL